jgi:hypothetical protein
MIALQLARVRSKKGFLENPFSQSPPLLMAMSQTFFPAMH